MRARPVAAAAAGGGLAIRLAVYGPLLGAALLAGAPPALALDAPAGATPAANPAQDEAQDDTGEDAAEPMKYRNVLRWRTASEVNNFGFDVYRGVKKDGPFERVTKKPIPGAGTIDTPQRYSWADETIDPTIEYWYYVESISMDGEREPFTPVIRAPAKIDPAKAESPPD